MKSALTQYLDLYRQHRTEIDRHAPTAVNALRPAAAELLERAGRLPDRRDDSYEKTSVEEMFAPDFGVNISRVNIPVDAAQSFRCDIPNLSTLMGITANDRFLPTSTLVKNLPDGVEVLPLSKANPELLEKYLNNVVNLEHVDCTRTVTGGGDTPSPQQVMLAFNSLLLQDGVLIHVKDGVKVDRPIQLVDIFSSPTDLLAFRRVLVVAGRNSQVDILRCSHTQTPATHFAASEVIEILAGEESRVAWYDLEEASPHTARHTQWLCRQEAGSHLTILGSTLSNGTTRNDYTIDILGDNCRTDLNGMAVASGEQRVDNHSFILHRSQRSHSNQVFKYVIDDNAAGAFEGKIEVARNARFNEAYQSNRNLLASDAARMHTTPVLLIYNDDVKCSHGASTGQLDHHAIFYMRSRGIPLDEARKMLMQAFMVDIVDKISLETLRDRLRHLLELRFAGGCGSLSCAGCQKQ